MPTARPASPTRLKAATATSGPAPHASPTPKAAAAAAAVALTASAAAPPPASASPAQLTPPAPALDQSGLQACVQAFVDGKVGRAAAGAPPRLSYDPATASSWAATLAGEARAAVRAFLAKSAPTAAAVCRYKVVAQVSIAQRVGQGAARSAGCLWAAGGGGGSGSEGRAGGVGAAPPPSTDGCGWAVAENDEVGVVVEAYALYVL